MRMIIATIMSAGASAFVYLAFGWLYLNNPENSYNLAFQAASGLADFGFAGLLFGFCMGMTITVLAIVRKSTGLFFIPAFVAFLTFLVLTLIVYWVVPNVVFIAYMVPMIWQIFSVLLSICAYLLMVMGTDIA